nr:hypothetical protein Iba_chr13dCG7120 [Ipomoea batatas]
MSSDRCPNGALTLSVVDRGSTHQTAKINPNNKLNKKFLREKSAVPFGGAWVRGPLRRFAVRWPAMATRNYFLLSSVFGAGLPVVLPRDFAHQAVVDRRMLTGWGVWGSRRRGVGDWDSFSSGVQKPTGANVRGNTQQQREVPITDQSLARLSEILRRNTSADMTEALEDDGDNNLPASPASPPPPPPPAKRPLAKSMKTLGIRRKYMTRSTMNFKFKIGVNSKEPIDIE